jgi:hypothetical protein
MRYGGGDAEQRSLSLVKGGERYVFEYFAGQEPEVLASMIELAENAESAFDWFDAAVLSFEMGRHGGQAISAATR